MKQTTFLTRRAFIKNSSLASGGLILGFASLSGCKPKNEWFSLGKELPEEWFKINSYLKIGENGLVTIMSPNPEAGQNVKTSMPMIIADELDVDWNRVIVEQASLDTDAYSFQFIGGSNAIRRGWHGLRLAGATARLMLKEAAAELWNVSVGEITTKAGYLYHDLTNKKI